MVAVPALMPVTTPVAGLTEATALLLLLQLPPAVASLNVVVAPLHTVVVPVIAATAVPVVTVTVVVAVAVPQLLVTL